MTKIITVHTSSRFKKSFKKLPKNLQEAVIKKDQRFRQNPFAPDLKTHQLKGKLQEYYSYSVNRSYRILFRFVNESTVLYFDIGTHEIYR